MNKLPVSTVKIIEDLDVLRITEPNTIFEIEGQVKIKELQISTNSFHSFWILKDNSVLTLETIIELNNVTGNIKILSNENSRLFLQLGISLKNQNHFSIYNKLLKNYASSTIKLHLVGDLESHSIIKTTGEISLNTKGNEFLEDVKYLMEEKSHIECIPELFVSAEDCIANHFVTIGCISDEDIFYLNCKGISVDSARNLIRQSFLKSMFLREEE